MHILVSSEFSNSITIGASSQAQWVRIANKVESVVMALAAPPALLPPWRLQPRPKLLGAVRPLASYSKKKRVSYPAKSADLKLP